MLGSFAALLLLQIADLLISLSLCQKHQGIALAACMRSPSHTTLHVCQSAKAFGSMPCQLPAGRLLVDAGMPLCRYKAFTVVETEMESAGSSSNGADPVKAPGKGDTFKTLAKYLGRGNSSKKELSMTTPVFSSHKRGTMSFYVAGDSKVRLQCLPVALSAS